MIDLVNGGFDKNLYGQALKLGLLRVTTSNFNVLSNYQFKVVGVEHSYDQARIFLDQKWANHVLGYQDSSQWFNGKYTKAIQPADQFQRYVLSSVSADNSLNDGLTFFSSAVGKVDYLYNKKQVVNQLSYFTTVLVGAMVSIIILTAVIIIFLVTDVFMERYTKFIALMRVFGYRRGEINSMTLAIFIPFAILGWLLSFFLVWTAVYFAVKMGLQAISLPLSLPMPWLLFIAIFTVKTYQEIEIDKNKVTLTEDKIYAVNTIYNVFGGDNNIYGVTPQNIKITTVLDRNGQIFDDHSFSVGIVFEVKYDINNSFEFLTNQLFWLSLKYLTPDEIIKNNLVFTVSSAFQITNNSMLGIGSQGAIAIEKTPTGYQTTDQELLQWDCDTVNHQNLLQLGRMIFPKNINKIPNNTMRINVIQHYPNNRQLYMVTQAVNNGQLAQPKYKAIKVQGNDQWDLLTVALIQVIEIRNKLYVAVINPATENLDPILFNLQYDGSDWMLDLTAPIFLNLKQGFIPGEEYLATNSLFTVKGVTYVMTTLGNLY